MDKKQWFNKREAFSFRKYLIGFASILDGSLLFLGNHMSTTDSKETQYLTG